MEKTVTPLSVVLQKIEKEVKQAVMAQWIKKRDRNRITLEFGKIVDFDGDDIVVQLSFCNIN